MKDTESFYRDLPVCGSFQQVAESSTYAEAPDEWFVVVTDVLNSTEAIDRGNYKEVNIVGALCIIGLTNAAEGFDFPYVFGGDGATALLSPRLARVCRTVMKAAMERLPLLSRAV